MSELAREDFEKLVVEHVKAKFPLVKLAAGEQPFSLRVNGQLAGLENLYRLTELRPDERIRHIDRWVVELIRASEGSPDRLGTFEELKDRIYPMVLPGTVSDSATGTVMEQLVDGLMIGYAIDSDRTISYIPREKFDEWKITEEQLHDTAVANLISRSESITAHAAEDENGELNLILFQTMDGYDASRVLLPNLHDRLREYLGSPFAAAIPNRDILLCFRNDEATVAKLRKQVAEDYRSMPHQVTDKLLLITPDGIAPRD